MKSSFKVKDLMIRVLPQSDEFCGVLTCPNVASDTPQNCMFNVVHHLQTVEELEEVKQQLSQTLDELCRHDAIDRLKEELQRALAVIAQQQEAAGQTSAPESLQDAEQLEKVLLDAVADVRRLKEQLVEK
ncbi:hypothetical protein [Mycolicibacterium brisbanense]